MVHVTVYAFVEIGMDLRSGHDCKWFALWIQKYVTVIHLAQFSS